MIVHSITVHKPLEEKPKYFPSFVRPEPSSWEMGKLEYALFLSKLPYKVGDFVACKHSRFPLLKKEIYKVVSIDEIHRFVTFAHPDIGPMCLVLKNAWNQVLQGRHGANLYRKVKEEELPEEIKNDNS